MIESSRSGHPPVMRLVILFVACWAVSGCGRSDSRATSTTKTNQTQVSYGSSSPAAKTVVIPNFDPSASSSNLDDLGSFVPGQRVELRGEMTNVSGAWLVQVRARTMIQGIRVTTQESGFMPLDPKPDSPGVYQYVIPFDMPQRSGKNDLEVRMMTFQQSTEASESPSEVVYRDVAVGKILVSPKH